MLGWCCTSLSPPALVTAGSDAKAEARATAVFHCVACKARAFWRRVVATSCWDQRHDQLHPFLPDIFMCWPKGDGGKGTGDASPKLDNSNRAAQSIIWESFPNMQERRSWSGIPEQCAEHLDRLLKGFCWQRQLALSLARRSAIPKGKWSFWLFVILLPIFFPAIFDESAGF